MIYSQWFFTILFIFLTSSSLLPAFNESAGGEYAALVPSSQYGQQACNNGTAAGFAYQGGGGFPSGSSEYVYQGQQSVGPSDVVIGTVQEAVTIAEKIGSAAKKVVASIGSGFRWLFNRLLGQKDDDNDQQPVIPMQQQQPVRSVQPVQKPAPVVVVQPEQEETVVIEQGPPLKIVECLVPAERAEQESIPTVPDKIYQKEKNQKRESEQLETKIDEELVLVDSTDRGFGRKRASLSQQLDDAFANCTSVFSLKEQGGFEEHPVYLHQLGKQYLDSAEGAFHQGDRFFEDRYTQRVQVIVETLEAPEEMKKPSRVYDESHDFNLGSMYEDNPYGTIFDTYVDTPIQKQLHHEIISTLHQTSELVTAYPKNPYAQTNAPVIYHFAALAKCQENVKAAFSLSDFCHNMFQVTQGLVLFTARFGGGLVKGYICAPFQDLNEWVKNPMSSLCRAVIGPSAQASLMLGQAVLAYLHDPDDFKKQAYDLWTSFVEADAAQKGYLLGLFLGPSPTSKLARRNLDFLKKDLTPIFSQAIEKQRTFFERRSEKYSEIKKVGFLAEPLKQVFTKAEEYVQQVKEIMTYKRLSKLLKRATPIPVRQNGKIIGYYEHQYEVFLKNNIKVVFRRDFGKYSHELPKGYSCGNGPIDHYNIEIHVPYRGAQYFKLYDDHIIPNTDIEKIRQHGDFIKKSLLELEKL